MSVQLSTATPNEKFKWVSSSVVLWKGDQDQRGRGTRNPLRWPLHHGVSKILENDFRQISEESVLTLRNVISWRNVVFLVWSNWPWFMPPAYHHLPCNSLAAQLSCAKQSLQLLRCPQELRTTSLNLIHLYGEVTNGNCCTSATPASPT